MRVNKGGRVEKRKETNRRIAEIDLEVIQRHKI